MGADDGERKVFMWKASGRWTLIEIRGGGRGS